MAKLVLAAAVALLVTFLGVITFCVVFGHLNIPGLNYYTQFVVALALLASTIYIFHHDRHRWPAILLLVGAVAVIIFQTHEFITWYILENHIEMVTTQHPWWWPTCTEDPRILHALSYLLYPMLCLPVAWFWYSFEATQRHLTKR